MQNPDDDPDPFPAGLPADIWREITLRLFVVGAESCRAVYRMGQTCHKLRKLSAECIALMKAARSSLFPNNDTEYIAAEIRIGTQFPADDDSMMSTGLVMHFEWINDQNLSVAVWRAIGGVVVSNIISSTINMHYHAPRVPVITTIVGVRNVGQADATSLAFTTNNEGGFTFITLNTDEAISVSHELNPIIEYVDVPSHADLAREHLDLLDRRSMGEKLHGLFCSVLSPDHLAAVNRCVISEERSRAFDSLGMTTLEDFDAMMNIVGLISADNDVLPSCAFIALLRDKPWILQSVKPI